MAVPGATTNYLTDGAGGTFIEAKQGGTILNNDDTGSVITKALTLLDGVATAPDGNTLPSIGASGIYNVAKALSIAVSTALLVKDINAISIGNTPLDK